MKLAASGKLLRLLDLKAQMHHERMDISENQSIALLGQAVWRNERKLFGIKKADRTSHLYMVGKTGTGKSTLIESMICQDMEAGEGVALFDPHGDLSHRVLGAVPSARQQDLIYFDVPDAQHPLGFNPLAQVPPSARPLAASNMLDAFKKIWADSWGPRLEHILRNALLALMDYPGATLADVLRLLDEVDFRRDVCRTVSNSQVRDFWLREYAKYPARLRAEAIAPVQNKVGAFLANPILRQILTHPESSLDLRQVIDDGKILLVNLAKGKLGEDAAALLGALLVSRLGVAALGRAEIPPDSRRHFYVYLDEFQTFTTRSLATMLAELRKYGVSLTLAHQYLSQLDPEIRDAILGNAGTIMSFRLGLTDAEFLAKEFYPEFGPGDLVALPNYQAYLKLMIDGVVSRPFSAETVPPPDLAGL